MKTVLRISNFVRESNINEKICLIKKIVQLTVSCIVPSPHELLWGNLVLAGYQLVDCLVIFQEELHANEWLLPLLGEHVELLWPGKQV